MARKREILTEEQTRAAGLLARGKTPEQAAAVLGVTPENLAEWGQSCEFVAEVNRARKRQWEAGKDGLRALVPKALQVLAGDLDQGEDPKLRQNAAAHILRAVGLYGGVGEPHGPTNAARVERDRLYELL